MKVSTTASAMALGAILALTITHDPLHAQSRPDPQKGCSNANLSGAWGFHVGARVLPAGTPLAVIGRQVFDGKGSWTGAVTINDNGIVTRINNDSGIYAVNPNCTGRITGAAGFTAEFVLVDAGNEALFMQTNPSRAVFLFGGAKKQFPDDNENIPPFAQGRPNPAKQCSNATTQGSYGFQVGATLVPAGSPVAVLGHQIADGRGNHSSTVTVNASGTIIRATDFGTYTVNPDCTARFVSGTGGGIVESVLVDGGREGYFLQTDPPAGVFVFSVVKKQFPGKNDDR